MLFMPCGERKGSAYYEFQYCKINAPIKQILKKYEFWADDSIVVHIDDDELFMNNYSSFLEHPYSPDGSNIFCFYGVNYYDKRQTEAILNSIRKTQPIDCEVLVAWLEKAVTDYNGFYFLGI